MLFPDWQTLAASGYLFRIVDTRDSVCPILFLFSDGDALDATRDGSTGCWSERCDPATLTEWCDVETESPPDLRRTIGEDLTSADLSARCKAAVLARVNEGWRDFLEAVAAHKPYAVAPTREAAGVNEGCHDSGGVGIYAVGDAFAIHVDSPTASDDRGPFTDPAEALRATLPDVYSLAGPEYHGPAFPEVSHA